MKATTDFVSDQDLQRSSSPYIIWAKAGWGKGRWYLIRKSDRHVVTSGDMKHCLRRRRTLTGA